MSPRYPRLLDSLRGAVGGSADKRSERLRASPPVNVHAGFGLPEKMSSWTLIVACIEFAGVREPTAPAMGTSDCDAQAVHHSADRRAIRTDFIRPLCVRT
jgi:hypothetical protein